MQLSKCHRVAVSRDAGIQFDVTREGSGSTRPGTNSAPVSTRPRVNSAGSTRPVYFPYGESRYHICT